MDLKYSYNFKKDKKKFWKGVNEVRIGESMRVSSVRNSIWEELIRENDVWGQIERVRCPVLNGDEIGEVLGHIRRGALKKMKGGKAAVIDGIVVEMMKNWEALV